MFWPSRRPLATPQLVHFPFGLFERLLALLFVVDNPLRKADGALHRQTRIADLLAEILQRASLLDVLINLPHPRLDAVVTRLDGQFDLRRQIELVAANCAGV